MVRPIEQVPRTHVRSPFSDSIQAGGRGSAVPVSTAAKFKGDRPIGNGEVPANGSSTIQAGGSVAPSAERIGPRRGCGPPSPRLKRSPGSNHNPIAAYEPTHPNVD